MGVWGLLGVNSISFYITVTLTVSYLGMKQTPETTQTPKE
jgi:hypothetical protein